MRAHEYCHTRYNRYAAMMALPLMTMSSITSTMAVTAVGEASGAHSGVGTINGSRGFAGLMAVMSCLVAVLTGMQSYFKFDARARDHLNSGRLLQEALSIVDQELTCGAIGTPGEGDAGITLQRIVLQVNNIYKLAPIIPYDVIRLYPDIRLGGSAASVVEEDQKKRGVGGTDDSGSQGSWHRRESKMRHRIGEHTQGVTTATLMDIREGSFRQAEDIFLNNPTPHFQPPSTAGPSRVVEVRDPPAPLHALEMSTPVLGDKTIIDDEKALLDEACSAYQTPLSPMSSVYQWTPPTIHRTISLPQDRTAPHPPSLQQYAG